MVNLLSYPHNLQKLYDEFRSADLSRPFPKYSEVRDLPYLDACVQEGVRMHPPFALPFERVVPEGDVTVLGHYLPSGTVVGGNPYVVNRHKATFGQDAEFWRPERWLNIDDACRKRLDQSILTVRDRAHPIPLLPTYDGLVWSWAARMPREAHWDLRDQETHPSPCPELRSKRTCSLLRNEQILKLG